MRLFNFLRRPAPPAPAQWHALIDRARQRMDQIDYTSVLELLAPLSQHHPRTDEERALLGLSLALLGECHFQLAQPDEAVAPTRRALELAREQGDAEAEMECLGNLYEIHRYRGAPDQAAGCAEALAERLSALGREGEAARYRKQSALVRTGEPLVRIVVDLGGQRCEMEEVLQGKAGAVRFAYERSRLTLRPCEAVVEEGERLAQEGHLGGALALFQQGAAADPFAPQPPYHAGLTLLHLNRPAEAAESLSAAEERAPGWFLSRPALWMAEKLAQGALPYEVFVAWHALEEGLLPPERKLEIVEQTLPSAPRVALLHLLQGLSLKARGAAFLAEAAFRRGLVVVEEPDTHTRLLVALASVVDQAAQRQHLLRQALDLGPAGNLLAQATARLVLAFEPEGQAEADPAT